MTYLMFSVKDEMTGKLMNPMYVENTGSEEAAEAIAIRQFKSQVNSIELWKSNPDDFSLYIVGEFNDESGASSTPLKKVTSGRSVING